MNVTITPTLLKGAITPPPSKSQSHRLIIAAELAGGGSISNLADSQDIQATRRCMAALRESGEELPLLDCGESGSTLRFLIPVALALRGGGRFTGRGRLMERPQKPYFDLFAEKGIFYEQKDGVLTVSGRLMPGRYALRGDVSSQFITGLLYALPLLEGDSEIVLTTPLESRDYVYLTIDVLKRFGVDVRRTGEGWYVPGGQSYRACDAAVEADWSQAAFWYAAAGTGSDVEVTGMNLKSVQGDRVILEWGRMINNEPWTDGITALVWKEVSEEVAREKAAPIAPDSRACSVSLDVSQAPDLVPPLAAWGALMNGALYLENAARLRMKESDRLAAVADVLGTLGAEVHEEPDRLVIIGKPNGLPGGVTVDSHNDHRIAMMAAIAATRCQEAVTITEAECVAKSYPNFWEDYEALGGVIRREG